jgi:hypothetical protein
MGSNRENIDMKPKLEYTEETPVKAEEYKRVRQTIYDRYPTGIDHMALGDTDSLFEELSGRIAVPDHFSSEHAIHLLNIQATKKHLTKYVTKLQVLYNIAKGLKKKPRSQANKAYKTRLNIRIDNLAGLINESRDNIKMSMYGINEQLTKNVKTVKECGYVQGNIQDQMSNIFGYSQHRRNIST